MCDKNGPDRIDVNKAVEALSELRPGYKDLLELYGVIFAAQEKRIDAVSAGIERLADGRAVLPVRPDMFKPDAEAADELLREICLIVMTAGREKAPTAARSLLDAVKSSALDTHALYERFLKSDIKYMAEQAEAIGAGADFLSFAVYHALRPSLVAIAQQEGKSLDRASLLDAGACPVCGSRPAIAVFGHDGKRFLYCSFCWFGWAVRRVFCPFCDNKDHEKLKYFEIEPETEYRIDVCDNCLNYIKTIDTKNMLRDIYPPLENVASLHIDLKARELGYKNHEMSQL